MNPPPELDHGRILIVDDNPTNIDVLFDFLADLGYEVLVAEDGQSALDRIPYSRPDLILLDIMMPRIDGYETCRMLKANPDTASIPVIFMTALDGLDDKMKGFHEGAVDYITKPFQNQEVCARVRTHLSLTRMRRDLQRQNEQLVMQNEALDTYARTVAHDLKNPLNLIINFARLSLEEPGLPKTTLEDLKQIVQSGERMNHIIHDLLLLAQMREGKVQPVVVNMRATVQQSLERLEADLKRAGAVVDVPAVFPNVIGHAAWVQAVWVNYISNALKYGGSPPSISLHAQADPDHPGFLLFSVKDNGSGVPEKMRYKIFEEFSRVGGEEAEGHGIGLSIVRRIIHRLGGRVGVDNNTDGPGATFYFSLPGVEQAREDA